MEALIEKENVVVADQWLMKKKIGSGSFGEVYLGEDLKTKELVAIKLEQRRKSAQLAAEYELAKSMSLQGTGFAKTLYYGSSGEYRVMVMTLLGTSLETCFQQQNSKFSLKTLLMFGEQAVTRLETLHAQKYVHCDLKPDNFLIGREDDACIVHLIDFGLSRPYLEADGKHVEYQSSKYLRGTARYASINAHRGSISRRDDLESLCYIMFYFYKNHLPWMGLNANTTQEKYIKIMEKKISTPLDELCEGMPPEFKTMVSYARRLEFTEEPDYDYMRSLIHSVADREGYELDGVFDWTLPSSSPSLNKSPLPQRLSNTSMIAMKSSTGVGSRKASRMRSSDFSLGIAPVPEGLENEVIHLMPHKEETRVV